MIKESTFADADAIYRRIVPAGDYWMHVVCEGETLRILDLEGNQAADTLFFNADDPGERYSASDTIREQGNIYLTAGTVLLSDRCRPMLTITADTVGRRVRHREQYGALCARKKVDACLPRQLHARDRRERALRAFETRHRP